MLSAEPDLRRRTPINSTTSRAGPGPTSSKSGSRLVMMASLVAAALLVLAFLLADRQKGSPPAPKPSASAARYLAIANAADRSLGISNDAYKKNELGDLAAAESDLRAEVATESKFDAQLARIPFPPSVAPRARALIATNQQRGALTARQERSTSLAQLRSFDALHQAADAAVEVQVRLLRQALHLPPALHQLI
jgi:hypothetical protein